MVRSTEGRDDTWERLCRRLTQSDHGAFEQIFHAIRDDLLGYVGSIVHDGPTAHDLVQDVFVALWNRRESLDPSLSLRAYLLRMARNAAYRHVRDMKIHGDKYAVLERRQEHDGGTDLPDDYVDAEMLEGHIRRSIDELPARQREALMLGRFYDLTHQEVAEVMGISPRTVNNHIVRALETLRDRLRSRDGVASNLGAAQQPTHGDAL